MNVELIDHCGTDLTTVNAARVSFANHHEEFQEKGDTGLINYLAKHGHWTPFSHCFVTFRIKAPIFVARQLFKHKVGLTENEISRRYVDKEPEFYYPKDGYWRGKAENKKQGSAGVIQTIKYYTQDYDYEKCDPPSWLAELAYDQCLESYNILIKGGVCPEQARMVLPQAMYTEWYWSGSMVAFNRICNLRISDDAQQESREIAEMIDKECTTLWPVSWSALKNAR